jgi:hypothetical protein
LRQYKKLWDTCKSMWCFFLVKLNFLHKKFDQRNFSISNWLKSRGDQLSLSKINLDNLNNELSKLSQNYPNYTKILWGLIFFFSNNKTDSVSSFSQLMQNFWIKNYFFKFLNYLSPNKYFRKYIQCGHFRFLSQNSGNVLILCGLTSGTRKK